MEQQDWGGAIEAILFALGQPVAQDRLAAALEISEETVTLACRKLAASYEERDSGIRLVKVEDTWQLVSAPQWEGAIRRVLEKKRADKLSPAALETLALVAYFQPVTRAGLDQIRGVDSAHSLALLLDRELIEPQGRLEAPGRPILYGTTPGFLRVFGLTSLKDLPPLPEELAQKGGGNP
jgi:segregation and condensation protein B